MRALSFQAEPELRGTSGEGSDSVAPLQTIRTFATRYRSWLRSGLGVLLLMLFMTGGHASAASPSPGEVRVGMLVYGKGQTSVCFADEFLALVARNSDIQVRRTFVSVDLASDRLFDYPFVVMSGAEGFSLPQAQKRRLKAYLERGGFILASSGCSNQAWIDSFKALMGELFGKDALQPIPLDHPLFHTLYDIDRIEVKKATPNPAIYGLSLKGRLRVVFSPLGLNDTADAGGGEAGGCCCCGGNEVRNARLINADALVYALTH